MVYSCVVVSPPTHCKFNFSHLNHSSLLYFVQFCHMLILHFFFLSHASVMKDIVLSVFPTSLLCQCSHGKLLQCIHFEWVWAVGCETTTTWPRYLILFFPPWATVSNQTLEFPSRHELYFSVGGKEEIWTLNRVCRPKQQPATAEWAAVTGQQQHGAGKVFSCLSVRTRRAPVTDTRISCRSFSWRKRGLNLKWTSTWRSCHRCPS